MSTAGDESTSVGAQSVEGTAARPSVSASVLLRTVALLIMGAALMPWWMTALSYYVGLKGYYDFSAYYVAALALRDNLSANVYDPHLLATVAAQHHVYFNFGVFQYPLLLPIVFILLTFIPFVPASLLWMIFDAAFWLGGTVLMIGLMRRGLHGAERRLPRLALRGTHPARWLGSMWHWWMELSDTDVFAIALVIFVSLSDDPLSEALRLGQASLLVFLLIGLAFWLMRSERALWLGVVLAVAVMVKALPIVLVGYFVLRGHWRVVAGVLIGSVIQLVGMALVVGPQGLLSMRGILGNGVGDSLHFQNEALARVPMWLGVAIKGHPSVPLIDAGYALIGLITLIFAGGVLFASWRRRQAVHRGARSAPGDASVDLLGFSWTVCTMLLVSPINWVHFSAWLLLPFAFCLGYALRGLSGGIRDAEGRLKPEVYVVLALVVGIVLTMYPLPFNFDRTATLNLNQTLFGRPIRPFFMLLRPTGGVLLWLASGVLFLRAVRLTHGMRPAPPSPDNLAAVSASPGAPAVPLERP
ncbi:MAG TPA: glycosyltransferase family 87 protein [Ktedonobacterales bacterium]|nr:glycosyltransferase family 87 protein [Ktedonobacterales bacterium]